MSKVQLQGNASGTGIFTIASPNSNTDRTLTLPDNTGTILTSASSVTQNSGPAFLAYRNSIYGFTTGTWSAIPFNQEIFDVTSAYNTTTGNFQPNVAGYYQLSATLRFVNGTTDYSGLGIYKNGDSANLGSFYGDLFNGTKLANSAFSVSLLMYLNGTTDYATVYAYTSAATAQIDSSTNSSFFSGILVRAA